MHNRSAQQLSPMNRQGCRCCDLVLRHQIRHKASPHVILRPESPRSSSTTLSSIQVYPPTTISNKLKFVIGEWPWIVVCIFVKPSAFSWKGRLKHEHRNNYFTQPTNILRHVDIISIERGLPSRTNLPDDTLKLEEVAIVNHGRHIFHSRIYHKARHPSSFDPTSSSP